jgi:hypothetical protein
MRLLLGELDEKLRATVKHGSPKHPEVYAEVRGWLWEMARDRDIAWTVEP